MNNKILSNWRINSVMFFSLSVFIMLFASFINSETVPEKYLQTFDERFYIDNVRLFAYHLKNQDFNKYYNSRLLMPALTCILMKSLKMDFSIENIRTVFLILNFLAIIVAFYYFVKISQYKNFSVQTVSVGIILIFVNFFLFKMTNFYPVLMDVFGFASGFALYYYYLKRSKLFYVAIAVSMFIFPTTVMILGLFLLSRMITFSDGGIPLKKYQTFIIAAVLLPVSLFLVYLAFYHMTPEKSAKLTVQIFSKEMAWLTILLGIFYLVFLLKHIIHVLDGIKINFKTILSSGFVFSAGIAVLYFLATGYLSANFKDYTLLTPETFFLNLSLQFLSFPFKFLISHFVYLGLPVIFLLIFHRRFFGQLKQEDPFLKIVPLLFLFLALGTETRQFLQFLPFVFIPLLSALQKIRFTNIQLIVFFTFQLLWSRFWFQINTPKGFLSEVPMTGNFFNETAQNYFQFHGPWMSISNSVMYGLIFVVVFALCWLLLRSSVHRKAELSK